MVSIDDIVHGLHKEPITGPIKSKMAEIRHLKNRHDVIAPVCEIVSKSDHPQLKKWRHVDFQDGGSQPYWILGVQ